MKINWILSITLMRIRNGIKIIPKVDYTIYESISMNFLNQLVNKSKNIISIKNNEGTKLNLINEILEKKIYLFQKILLS